MGFVHVYMGIYGAGSATVIQPVDGWIPQTRVRHWVGETRVRHWITAARLRVWVAGSR